MSQCCRRRPTSPCRRRNCRVRPCRACKTGSPSDRHGPSSPARTRTGRWRLCHGRRNRAAVRARRIQRPTSPDRRSIGRSACGRARCRTPGSIVAWGRLQLVAYPPGPRGRGPVRAQQTGLRVSRRVRSSRSPPPARRRMQRPKRQAASRRHHHASPDIVDRQFSPGGRSSQTRKSRSGSFRGVSRSDPDRRRYQTGKQTQTDLLVGKGARRASLEIRS